jgi:ankyrin repeat protein
MAGQDTENLIMLLYDEDWDGAQAMLDAGLDINDRGHSDRTALSAMAGSKCHKAMKFLLDRKADPNIHSSFGGSAIHWAILHKDDEGLEMLMSGGGDPDLRKPKTGETPLLQAIRHGSKKAVEIILEHGADPNLTDRDGTPPVLLAMEYNRGGIAGAMMGKGATLKNWTREQMDRLHGSSQPGVVETILQIDEIMQKWENEKRQKSGSDKQAAMRRYLNRGRKP